MMCDDYLQSTQAVPGIKTYKTRDGINSLLDPVMEAS